MRRPSEKLVLVSEHPYKKIKPFFWTKCDKCYYEIKKECMWRITIKYNVRKNARGRQFHHGKIMHYNICLHCCPSKQDIKKYIADNLVGKFYMYARVDLFTERKDD